MSTLPQAAILLGVTGASGTIYAARLAEHLHRLGAAFDMVFTEAGRQVQAYEGHKGFEKLAREIYALDNWFAPPASGSARYHAMVVLPCSMGSLGKIAAGIADNLLTRAADVFIKEKRKLIMVPREMPFSELHLENMLRLHRAGACIIPASPHYYMHPQSIEEVADTVVAKILEHLGYAEHGIHAAWGEKPTRPNSGEK